MKRHLALSAIFVIWAGWLVPGAAGAAQFNLPSGETRAGNLYATGEKVEISGKVEGDVYVIGGTVVVSGEVEGDVLVLGGRVRVAGPVVGSVRVVGGEVELASTVGRNVSVAAGKLTLTPGSYVFGRTAVAAGELVLSGTTEGPVEAAAGQAVFEGTANGPLDLWLDRQGKLRITERAVAEAAVRYRGGRGAQVAPGAQLAQAPEQLPLPAAAVRPRAPGWFGELAWFFGLAVLAMVLAYLMPRKLQEVAEQALAKPWQSLGWGVAWLVGAPIVALLLAVTLIGLPLAIVLMAVYVAGALVAQVAAGAAVGWYVRTIPTFQAAQGWKLLPVVLLGLAAYRLAAVVPYVGSAVGLLALVWGWGAVLRVQRRTLSTFT